VNELINANKTAGYGSVEWDATDSYGNVMSAGVYIFQLRVANLLEGQATVRTKKMVLLK
jgi:flagellar hook assembly protein FlgD